jgi:hypothetical protein
MMMMMMMDKIKNHNYNNKTFICVNYILLA